MDSREMLDKNQKFLVEYYPNGKENLKIIAGAGSGKTETICCMAENILKKEPTSKICMISFTKKAAGELQERMTKKLGEKIVKEQMTIGTIHKIMKDIKLKLSESEENEIDNDALKIKSAELERKYNLFELTESYSTLYDKISYLKNVGTLEEDIIDNFAKWYEEYANKEEEGAEKKRKDIENFFKEYNDYKNGDNQGRKKYIDFDDMLNLEGIDEKELSKCFNYIFVDEFQDVNQLQYNLFKKFKGESTRFIMIGDDDQAIYGFRGSDLELFQKIEDEDEFAAKIIEDENRKVQLSINYRSNYKDIIEKAKKLIECNPNREKKEIEAHGQQTGGLSFHNCQMEDSFWDDEFDGRENGSLMDIQCLEAQEIYYIVKNAIKEKKLSEYTILYRSNFQIYGILDYFLEKNIPFILFGKEEDYMGIFHFLLFRYTWQAIYRYMQNEDSKELIRDLAYNCYCSEEKLEDNYKKINEKKSLSDKLDCFFGLIKSSEESDGQKKVSYTSEELVSIRAYIQELQEFERKKQKKDDISMSELISALIRLPRYHNIAHAKDQTNSKETKSREKGQISTFSNRLMDYFRGKTYEMAEIIYEKRRNLYETTKAKIEKMEKQEKLTKEEDCIRVMTIHKSKGLTFDKTIVVGNSDRQFPSDYAINDEEKEKEEWKSVIAEGELIGRPCTLLSEERRLMYVALTRAKNKTYLLYVKEPSVFLKELGYKEQ